MDHVDRREFLRFAAASLTISSFAGLGGCVTAAPKKVVSNRRGKVFFAVPKTQTTSIVRNFDWDTFEQVDHEAPVGIPHSILQDPFERDVVFVVENLGSCARLDMRTGRSITIDHVLTGQMANGHAVSSADGKLVFLTQVFRDGETSIGIRDAKTLALVDRIPGGSRAAHQIVHLPGSTIVAWGEMQSAKGEYGGGITFYDYSAGKIVNRVNLDVPILHLVPTSPTEVLGLGFPHDSKPHSDPKGFDRSSRENQKAVFPSNDVKPAPIYQVNVAGRSRRIFDEAHRDDFRFNFGLAVLSKDDVFVSGHVASNKVIVWKGFEIVRVLDVKAPRNIHISDDGEQFMVLSSNGVEIFSLATQERLQTITSATPIAAISGYKVPKI